MRLLYTVHHFSRKQFFQKHSQTIKYSLFVLCIIGTLLVVRMYINYTYIVSAIEQEKQETKKILNYNEYLHFYRKQYITSPYAIYFQNHENKRIQHDEILVIIKTNNITQENQNNVRIEQKKEWYNFSKPPHQQWQELWREKFTKIFQK